MNTADIDDLIKKIDDGEDTYTEELQSPVYFTQMEKDLILDALVFYKEMQVI